MLGRAAGLLARRGGGVHQGYWHEFLAFHRTAGVPLPLRRREALRPDGVIPLSHKTAGWMDDRLIAVMARLARFCRERQACSHQTETVPSAGVLFSAHSLYRTANRMFGGRGIGKVLGRFSCRT